MSLLAIYLILISSFFIPSHTQSPDESHISARISQPGINVIKDLLVTKAVSSLADLQVPQIEKSASIPIIGDVDMVLSDITIYGIEVPASRVKLSDSAVVIVALGTTCNLSMHWRYSYSTWLFTISDSGDASVQVEGMDIGLTLGLANQGGSLKLSLMDSGCYVKDISIKLDGGASWLYQGLVDAFEGQIESAIENAITKKLGEGVSKLDSLLQDLPKEIPVDDIGSLNITFVNDPLLTNSSMEFAINGLFTQMNKDAVSSYYGKTLQPSVLCTDPSKMLGISLDEDVFNSASALYYSAGRMQWVVAQVSDQSLLNTAGWKYIVPQLYKNYPNDDMNLNISLSAPPSIQISPDKIDATVYSDLTVDVLEASDVIPVACISLVIRGSISVKMFGNNLAGSVKLDDFTMSLAWSKIGKLRMYLIQPVVRTLIETVVLPYANLHLAKGFPLPIIRGFTLQNAEIICSSSVITVCSNVVYEEAHEFKQPLVHWKALI